MSIENITIEVPSVVGQTTTETLQAAVHNVLDTASDMSYKAVETAGKTSGFLGTMAKSVAGVVVNTVKEHKTVVIATAAVAGVAAVGTIGYKYFQKKRNQQKIADATAVNEAFERGVKASVSANEDGIDLNVDLG